jgi:hypothetical protein
VCDRRNAPVYTRAFTLAVPASDDHQVQRVTTALSFEVILACTRSTHAQLFSHVLRTFLSLSQLSERLDGSYVASSDLTMRPLEVHCTKHATPCSGCSCRQARRTFRICGYRVVEENGELFEVAAAAHNKSPGDLAVMRKQGNYTCVPRAFFGELQLALGLITACVEKAAAL